MKSIIDRAGRVVIPKAIREAAGLKPGSALTIAYRDGQVVIEPKSPNAANPLGIAQNRAVPERDHHRDDGRDHVEPSKESRAEQCRWRPSV
jgi:AbrB family looped-hinge helix DNA binding protein